MRIRINHKQGIIIFGILFALLILLESIYDNTLEFGVPFVFGYVWGIILAKMYYSKDI
jgi:hypothetical protein